MADLRLPATDVPDTSAKTDLLLRFKHPKLQASFACWLNVSCLRSDAWSIPLYAALCVALTLSMVKRVGEIGVPSLVWLVVGLVFRLAVCLGTLLLRLHHTELYLRYRTRLMYGVVLACHCSGLLLEAPLAYYLTSSRDRIRYSIPLLGQVFELLGLRVSFQDHIFRGILDMVLSFVTLSINLHFGCAGNVSGTPGRSTLPALFLNEYVICNLVLMTFLLYWYEKRAQADFLSSAGMSKLLGTDDRQSEQSVEDEDPATIQAQLSDSLESWAELHKFWVPRCTPRVLSVKFEGPDFESLSDELASNIRSCLAEHVCHRDSYCQVAFMEGCIQVISTSYHQEPSISASGTASASDADWFLDGDAPSEDDDSMELGDMSMPAPSEMSGIHDQQKRDLSDCASSPIKETDRQNVKHLLEAVPKEWLQSGKVTGYTNALGCFEYSSESHDLIFPDTHPSSIPSILGVLPACVTFAHGQPVQFNLICQMTAGDPIICLQDGIRVPLTFTGSTQLDALDGNVTYQVTLEVNPNSLGYLEFYIVSKTRLLPFNTALRSVDNERCADAAFGMLGASGLAAHDMGEVVSQPAPALLLHHPPAAWDFSSLVQPLAAYDPPSRPSMDSADSSSDNGSDAQSSCMSSFTRAHVQGFQHYPHVAHVQDLSSFWESTRRFQQVQPTLMLCGVVSTYFRLASENTVESLSKQRDLLLGRDIASMEEWSRLVESCILFLARNGLPHATMLFLRTAVRLGLCQGIKNLMHYAVASGSVDLVRALTYECGAALSKPSDYGTTPLHLAAVLDTPDILAALLENQTHRVMAMECADASGKTPIEYAMETGRHSNVDLIKSGYAPADYQGHSIPTRKFTNVLSPAQNGHA
eukprot:CAMPEP_0117661690 /NCGR_PEP_ID=MMETSP0804-20121206/7668_1 /TAXON_ID=1074897 /ORGANISM="Tetraselmis astigmatica, Strain CCMP880" /LENGTH=868 /DNA_ID=CAMNT_0005468567 /DNA_START=193 /DNA_END=2799 /DNA_ORIENTATION=-